MVSCARTTHLSQKMSHAHTTTTVLHFRYKDSLVKLTSYPRTMPFCFAGGFHVRRMLVAPTAWASKSVTSDGTGRGFVSPSVFATTCSYYCSCLTKISRAEPLTAQEMKKKRELKIAKIKALLFVTEHVRSPMQTFLGKYMLDFNSSH